MRPTPFHWLDSEDSSNIIIFVTDTFYSALKLFKLNFMVRFINILRQIWSVEEGATSRLVLMKTAEDAQKINEDYHKVYTISKFLVYVN